MFAEFKNKVLFVTGAASGMGRAVAVRFGSMGCKVAVAARKPEKAAETVRMVEEAGGQAIFVPCDVSDEASVRFGIREVGSALGCYAVSGALMGVVGFISLANTGSQQMALNFGSIGIMFTAFLPMFIGGWIGRYINKRVGIMLGAVSMALISLAYARFDTASSVQSIVSALLLVLFLIYLNNEFAILSRFRKKQEAGA